MRGGGSIPDSRFQIPDSRARSGGSGIPNSRTEMRDSGFQTLGDLESGIWNSESRDRSAPEQSEPAGAAGGGGLGATTGEEAAAGIAEAGGLIGPDGAELGRGTGEAAHRVAPVGQVERPDVRLGDVGVVALPA